MSLKRVLQEGPDRHPSDTAGYAVRFEINHVQGQYLTFDISARLRYFLHYTKGRKDESLFCL